MSSPRLLVHSSTVNRLLLETEQSYSRNNHLRIIQDCQEALRQCPSLVARVDTLTHNNGFVSRLICLGGTVAVRYKGNGYNIPVDIWIPEPYPSYPPLVYVTPTPNMYIPSDHPYVDTSGLVNLTYLAKWDPSSYSIAGLIGVLVSIFSSKPPVFAKTSRRSQSAEIVNKPLPVSPTCRAETPPTQRVSAEEEHRREMVTLVSGKVKGQLENAEKKGKTEISQLLEVRQALQKGAEAIQEGLDSISVARVDAEREFSNTERQLTQTRQWLEENKHLKGTLDIDDIIIFPDNVQRKIVQYRAKDSALQDALCLLDEALEMNLIDLAVFLKEVRRLAKEQYKCRGMIQYLSRNRKCVS
ncbi:Tumor susceptibility gene 101 protein [Galdieria sulphuraria]|uniref:ESCRT-I complex subunit TSG11 n=1 Tax=Galdieria sulphuraria TaxID=130081 RepID=M2WWG6_GALSU|nr:ESCRT-I complex subunit TSG11 [Galdieria sulphuraria]EME28345.1 ESCRT-I complex subunit TSG11 [Galdieria sulphuraria]GJD12529.1 Tumor susceptibility gene 101 protein [Galdieria sulphuraria]|eukprot:XP_005704865.1 ESCRT-I complex subunit TSG11 [Galdieria sulphuraria]